MFFQLVALVAVDSVSLTSAKVKALDAATPVATPITTDISALPDGVVTLCLIARDTAGNWQSESATATPGTRYGTTGTLEADPDGETLTITASVKALDAATPDSDGETLTITASDPSAAFF